MNEATSLLMHPSTGNNSVRKTTWDILHYKASAEHKTRIERISSAVEIFILNLILVNVLLTIWASLEIDETSNRKSCSSLHHTLVLTYLYSD